MPLVSRTFDQLIDFTRTSAATYVDASGRIVPTAASRNLLTFTQEFDNAVWSKLNGSTVATNSTTAPDGTLTADTLVEPSATNIFGVRQASTLSAGTTTFSVFVKPNGRNWVQLTVASGGSGSAFFNVASGVVGTTSSATATITSAGNGWFRCSMTFTAASGSNTLDVRLASADGTTSYAGDGTSGVFLWGAQLEAGSTLTNYTRNNGGVYPPRFDYDPVTLAPNGLLVEEQRTNLLTYSQEFDNAGWVKYDTTITANATTSPSGDNSADLILPNTSNAFHAVEQTVSIGTRTFSLYAKAAGYNYLAVTNSGPLLAMFNLSDGTVVNQSGVTSSSITAVGNGWYRCVVTLDATYTGFTVYVSGSASSVTTFAGDGTSGVYLWGAQAEAGAFATSYIPTVASQVTRTADVATITGANFSQWYNQSEGSLVVEGSVYAFPAASSNNAIAALSDGTTANSHYVYTFGSAGYAATQVSSVVQANPTSGSALSVNTPYKMAYGYKTNDFAFTVNGATVGTDASGTVPAVDQLQIGRVGSTILLNGWIRSIRFFPTRLSNAQLQALTA